MIGVIGGSGFLGSFILEELDSRGISSLCLDISRPVVKARFFEFDVTSPPPADCISECSSIINRIC